MAKKIKVKKILFVALLSCFATVGVYSQSYLENFDRSFSRADLRKKINAKTEENIVGSPYFIEKFLLSEIVGVSIPVLIRYNGYKDEVEVKKDDEIYLLPKDSVYGEIVPKIGNYKIKFFKNGSLNGEHFSGYLFSLFSNNNVELLKRDKIVLQKAKEADNSYDMSVPPKYVKAKTEYLIKLNVDIFKEFPKGKKELIALYPAKKAEIETFLKENKVSFKEEKDMVKITEFIASL